MKQICKRLVQVMVMAMLVVVVLSTVALATESTEDPAVADGVQEYIPGEIIQPEPDIPPEPQLPPDEGVEVEPSAESVQEAVSKPQPQEPVEPVEPAAPLPGMEIDGDDSREGTTSIGDSTDRIGVDSNLLPPLYEVPAETTPGVVGPRIELPVSDTVVSAPPVSNASGDIILDAQNMRDKNKGFIQSVDSGVLPDEMPDGDRDLRDWYSLFALLVVGVVVVVGWILHTIRSTKDPMRKWWP